MRNRKYYSTWSFLLIFALFLHISVNVYAVSFEKTEALSVLTGETSLPSNSERISALSSQDPYASMQWYLDEMNADLIWENNYNGKGVRIAILDSGINSSHQDLQGIQIIHGGNYTDSDSNDDLSGHGTFIAGLIAAKRQNGLGICGLTDEVTLIDMKVLDGITGRLSSAVQAIYDSVNLYHCDIINISFGTETNDPEVARAIQYAVNKGVLIITSVGNSGTDTLLYPAAFNSTVGVGYINENRVVSPNSQRNSSVDIVAPGVSLLSLDSSDPNGYRFDSGSSFSAALITSLAAVAKQIDPHLNQNDFTTILRDTATDAGTPGYDTSYGWGIVNASAFINSVKTYLSNAPLLAPFQDLSKHWARIYISELVQRKIMNGVSASSFQPSGVVTRAMTVTTLARLAGNSTNYNTPFTDISPNSWYASSIGWAYQKGITLGTSLTTFSPNDPVTREQLCTLMYRFLQNTGVSPSALPQSLSRFPDSAKVSPYATEAMAWATSSGILQGSSDGLLHPKEFATRAELAAILIRFIHLYSL